jgi:hypothetical protein
MVIVIHKDMQVLKMIPYLRKEWNEHQQDMQGFDDDVIGIWEDEITHKSFTILFLRINLFLVLKTQFQA